MVISQEPRNAGRISSTDFASLALTFYAILEL
jgi:hypothetical protein